MREKATRGKYYVRCVCIVVQLLVVGNTHSDGWATQEVSELGALFSLSLARTSPSFFIFFTLHAGCRVSIYGGRVYTRRQQNKTCPRHSHQNKEYTHSRKFNVYKSGRGQWQALGDIMNAKAAATPFVCLLIKATCYLYTRARSPARTRSLTANSLSHICFHNTADPVSVCLLCAHGVIKTIIRRDLPPPSLIFEVAARAEWAHFFATPLDGEPEPAFRGNLITQESARGR